MERKERARVNMEASDSTETKQSKQRASIKWLLSKAFNNRVPDNLVEPFYRDHEDQEHLKPPIVGGLANAELYCVALANMYSDPNYHSLNHWNILQTLVRKGVALADPNDCALTETVLIQTNPLKMSAHMCVIEALMSLYAREVVTIDRVSAAAQRFGSTQPLQLASAATHEDGLLAWINAAVAAMNKAEENSSQHVPAIKNFQDLCDGTALAALISFYCPEALPRTSVRVGRMSSIQDCLHNLMLVYEFCTNYLPHNVFHMLPEDVTYMRGSMRQNLVALLADLFNMLEVHPVKCVKYPGVERGVCNEHGVRHKRCLPPPPPHSIPDLRPEIDSPGTAAFTVSWSTAAPVRRSVCSTPERRSSSPAREHFVVHRGRGVPTLASVARRDDDTSSVDTNSERQTAAGRPSKWGEAREGSFAGRRSRRSSITEDSQLTVENFGGSQDRLHFAGKNPEKELATLQTARKISAPAGPQDYSPPTPVRSSRQDIRGSIQFFHDDYHNGSSQDSRTNTLTNTHRSNQEENRTYKVQRQNTQQPDSDRPFFPIKRQLSSDTITLNKSGYSSKGGGDSFFLNRDVCDGDGSKDVYRSNGEQVIQAMSEEEPTLAANTTTWQKKYMQLETQPNGTDEQLTAEELSSGGQMAAQLNNIRLKLEEKRRRIEGEKRRMEIAVTRQRQQLGHQAFLQAVTRETLLQTQLASLKGGKTPGDDVTEPEEARPQSNKDMLMEPQNVNNDTSALEQYQQSIAKMNSNLQEIQSDIARLANQQSQLQQQQAAHLQQQQQTQLQQQQAQLQHQLSQLQQQQQQQQNNIYQPQQPYQQVFQQNIPQLHQQFGSTQNVSLSARGMFGSSPHMSSPAPLMTSPAPLMTSPAPVMTSPAPMPFAPEPVYRDVERQFYLHEANPTPTRRTWAQHAAARDERNEEMQFQQQQNNHQYHPEPLRGWHSPSPQPSERAWTPQGFVLHERTSQPFQIHYNQDRYHNGTREDTHLSYTLNQYSQSPPRTSSPRSNRTPQRERPERLFKPETVSLQQLHSPPSPPDDMEPQNISFIGNDDSDITHGMNRINISSGTRTYRIPSPTRPSLNRNSFQQIEQEDEKNKKTFYVPFDNEQPKKPKPPLRKRGSPKKGTPTEFRSPERRSPVNWNDRVPQNNVDEDFPVHKSSMAELRSENKLRERSRESAREPTAYAREVPRERPQRVSSEPAALVIADSVDPNSAEEMERKKERIMLLSLQRRQRAEEARARAEQAAAAKREREEQAREERNRRREEQARRREIILSQYKMKKAIEEAEREGKVLDKAEVESLRVAAGGQPATTRMRPKAATRTRPKTIHVDSANLHQPLLHKQPSSTNLTAGRSTMRRDYYRGSQDSLAERAALYDQRRDSPVEDRGALSPSSAGSGPLGRRGSCKTSRENELDQPNRGRSKYTSYQGSLKAGRKSSSLMNLCDSGLGRWTPPRRAPSPLSRGPPSLPGASMPGAVGRRRTSHNDDNSDASSHHSSIVDYSGPRLYKQPATKSNRGIMLNAIEYCVFPGAVNAEAKRRVLEEIARSESKHFLVLFRGLSCQFRALYSYCPDTDRITKLYGTGPRQVDDKMFDKFFKYNSGSKCFSQVHTKHLTVTIDAFTIHDSLWQGKKVQLPSKKDMALVI